MDKQWLIEKATGVVARGVMKLALITGGGVTATTQDKATQIASAIVTLIVFAIEQWQSWQAHKTTARNAVNGQ